MKILYLGNDKPFCTERFVAEALQSFGHDVKLNVAHGTTPQDVQSVYDKQGIDLLLFSKPYSNHFPELLQWCRTYHVMTVCWQWDLYWGYRPQRPPQFYSDYLFTTDGGHDNQWKKHGYNHRTLRQGIHDPHLSAPVEPTQYRWDVAFVGTVWRTHQGRQRMVRHLSAKHGNRFLLVTNRRGLVLTEVLNHSKIVVGDSYPSPNYWSNRIYEMLGRSCFLVYPFTDGLDAEFTSGVHYAGFERDDMASLDRVVDRYLQDDTARNHIRRLGYEIVRDRYTYRHRVEQLLRMIC